MPRDSTRSQDILAMDSYLRDSLQVPVAGKGVAVVARDELGVVTHTFSHVFLTLKVERIVLKVSS